MIIPQKSNQKLMIVVNEFKIAKEKKYPIKGIRGDIDYLLARYEFEKQKDGWYLGTVESCRKLLGIVSSNSFLIDNLSTFIWWDTQTNLYTDCLQEYAQYLEERRKLNLNDLPKMVHCST